MCLKVKHIVTPGVYCESFNGLLYACVLCVCISRSKQAPGSGFHPCDRSDKIYCGLLGPAWCNKKVNPERYVSCGSYELFVTNVAHQMNETLCFKITCPLFLIKILSK